MASHKPEGTSSYHARDLLNQLSEKLASAGISSPRLDANQILQMALSRDETILSHHEIILDTASQERLDDLLAQRLAGCPVSRLRGYREFYSMNFFLNKDTLDPRPDSEVLVEKAIAAIQDKAFEIADFGTGSGCLLLATLAHCQNAKGIGLDISDTAIEQARKNAAHHKLEDRAQFLASDWDKALAGNRQFDLILSNPPYISEDDRAHLSPEVAIYDPSFALFAGKTGLDAYQILLPIIARRLKAGGASFVEIGKDQESDVISIASTVGLRCENMVPDLSGIIRCLHFIHD